MKCIVREHAPGHMVEFEFDRDTIDKMKALGLIRLKGGETRDGIRYAIYTPAPRTRAVKGKW